MQYGNENVGLPTDPEAGISGDGTVIALLKRIRTILLAVAAASAFTFIGTRLATDSVVAVSTAAAPVYGEGDAVKLSTDLAGTLRTTAGGGGGGGATDSTQLRTGMKHAGRVAVDSILANMTHVGRVTIDSILANMTHVGRVTVDSILANMTHIGRAATDSLFTTNPITSGANDFIALGANAVPVRPVFNEDLNGVYSFTLQDIAGVAAANNFACLFNLGASTDTAIVLSVTLGRYSNAAATTSNSIVLFRVTTCTVGTLQATTAINEFTNSFTAATMEVRTGNPTTTNAAAVYAWAPCHAITAAGTTGCDNNTYALPFRLLLAPGEGVVFRQTVAGDTDQRYSLTIVWGERN
jgi:hypothetical protein